MIVRFASPSRVAVWRSAVVLPVALTLIAAAPQKVLKPTILRKPPPAAPVIQPLGDTVRVALVTTLGTIELELDHRHAPVTVANFIRYVDARRFDGMTFYRAMRLPWGTQPNGLIQAGLQANPNKVFPPIIHEPTSQTGILHKAGTISMARYAPGTAMADFSILLSDLPSLDSDPKGTTADAQAGFAAFGKVVSGMDTVRRIWDAPLSPTKGEGPLKGQMLEPPVTVLTVRRAEMPKASPPGQ